MLLNETQSMIRDSVRAFARDTLKPNTMAYEEAAGWPPQLWKQLAELGLLGMVAPEEFGGSGADYVSYALSLMEIAAGDGALSTAVSIQNMIVNGIIADGSEAQKTEWLPRLCAGDAVAGFALTEADAGSDASAIRTRAEKVDGGWKINGAK